MDRISGLPDSLLLQILSFIPTKDVVATAVLSKRWQSLWTLVPELKYDDSYHNTECWRFSRFVDRSLLLHKAPVLESLDLQIGPLCSGVDIGVWIRIAVERCLRKLKVEYLPSGPIRLPRSLYACETLVVLKLKNAILVDVPFPVNLQSLKTLHLRYVKFLGDESVSKLLSNCPNLEELVVRRSGDDNVTTFVIAVSSLLKLSIANHKPSKTLVTNNLGFALNAPSLTHLNVFCCWKSLNSIEDMPELVAAKVNYVYGQSEKLLRSLTSVKHLSLSSFASKVPYPTGSIFYRLVILELYTCIPEWWNLLTLMLENSPKLRVLWLTWKHQVRSVTSTACWNPPGCVPECLSFHLETFQWRRFTGTQQEKEVAVYILTNARRLKTAAFSSKPINLDEKFQMLKELASVARGSTECQLAFD